MSNHYEERDAFALDKAGGYYSRHVVAMTKEWLHSKSDIAAELAHRDREIDLLKAQIECLRNAFDELHGVAASCNNWEKFPQAALDKACNALMARPVECLTEIKAQAVEAEYKDLLHVVANQYDGNDGREWSTGANHVFMLFAKEINKRVNQVHHQRGKND